MNIAECFVLTSPHKILFDQLGEVENQVGDNLKAHAFYPFTKKFASGYVQFKQVANDDHAQPARRFRMKKLLIAFALTLSTGAFAQGLQLGYPSTGGNGCPQGSVSASLSPDNSQLSILFDSFVAEAGPASGRTLDRKSCNISIPVTVPNGYSVSVVAVDYRGFVGLPNRSANARFTAEYFFANQPGPRTQRQFIGAQNTDYLIENDLVVSAIVWSACGAQTNLRINASMMLQNTSFQDALATVDSADISSGIIYQLKFRPCR